MSFCKSRCSIVLLVAIMVLSFCCTLPVHAAGKAPYKIGAVFALTGPAASLGIPERDTALMVAEQINARGGINGHPLQVIIYDTAGEESKCILAAKRLIEQDKVVAIIGPSRTGESLALVDTIKQAKIPLVSCAAGIQIVKPVQPWIFKTPQSDVLAVMKIMNYLRAHNIKNVAIMSESNAYGESGKTELEKRLPTAGIKIVAAESYGDKDVDVTAQLVRVKMKNPQAIIDWGTSQASAVVTKNARTLQIKCPIIMSHGIANKTYLDLSGPAANGVIFPAGKLLVASELPKRDPQRAQLIKYAADFQNKYGRSTDTFGGHAWDAMYLVVNALRKVGPDPAKIRTEIESTAGFVGIGGIFTFSPQDHNGLSPDAFAMVKVVNGKWTTAK
jgi:branched-chain amino acid transport system substrate-binding protein